jgi:hypothetical protein
VHHFKPLCYQVSCNKGEVFNKINEIFRLDLEEEGEGILEAKKQEPL